MKVLLIGGTGIISSEVCKLLLDKDNIVSIINRGYRKNMLDPRAKLIVADIRHDDISKLVDNYYDVVIDFISYDTEQLKKMLDYFSDHCGQFVFISSATVYKTKEEGQYRESDAIGNEEWEYCIKKVECENLLRNSNLNCEYTIVRPYVTYGKTRVPYQFCPLEYYTIINRIVNDKPIPIYRPATKCTVTYSAEFAIGVVGLLLNPKAYGEAFHITCSYSTSWKEIIEELGRCLNRMPVFIDVPDSVLEKEGEYTFSVAEIKGDKSRNMIFDNSKIREAVPEFKGEIQFKSRAQEIVDYYINNVDAKKINYRWDASVDKMLSKVRGGNKFKTKLSIKGYSQIALTTKNKKDYMIARYEIIQTLRKLVKH